MVENANRVLTPTVVAAALLLAGHGTALAEDGTGTTGSISIGVGNWSDGRRQAGAFDGMRDSGHYLLLDGDLRKRDDATGTWLGLKARSLGLDSREFKGEWLRQGNIGFSLEYRRISRDQPFVYNTGLQGIGTTTQAIPVPGIAPGTGTNWELGTTRDRISASFYKRLTEGLNLNVSFRNEKKDGTRPWSRGGQPEFAVEPISSTIRLLEATLSYSSGRLQLSGGYYGTSFDNNNSLVLTTGTASGATTPALLNLTLPLSNMSHEMFLNGGFNFTPTTRGTFKASYSRATQDEFLPTAASGLTWCATCAPDPLAPSNLDGRLDTTLLEAGLTARPMPKLSLAANLRYRDFADKTPLMGIVFAGGVPTVYNTPFSYTNKTGKLEANYRLPQGFSLLGGIEQLEQDRQVPNVGTLWVPFRAELEERTYRVQLRKSMSERVNGSLAYLRSNRDGSNLTLPLDPAEPEQDLINPLNIADRKRDKWRAMVDWSPVNRLGLQFVVEDSRDDYSGPNPYGLQEGKARLYSLDGSYQVTSNWHIHAWISRDETKANELTLNGIGTSKYNDLSEIGDSFGLGVKGQFSAKLKMGGDVEQFRSVSSYKQTITGGALGATQAPLPEITNTLLRFRLYADYAVQKHADVRISLIHERWSTDDWSWFMLPATGRTPWAFGVANDGTTVLSSPRDHTTFVGVRYVYRFQ